jgi:acyl carrier protein
MALDCFVLYSSWSAVNGSPGQSNHSSANAFMDALAWHRRSMGLPALSINWGAWSEVGVAVRQDVLGLLARKGIGSVSPAQGHEALARLLGEGARQVSVTPLDAGVWCRAAGTASAAKLVELLVEAEAPAPAAANSRQAEAVPLRSALLAATAGSARRQVMEGRLRDHLARVLRLPAARLDQRRPFKEMGLDSLTALELRNHLDADSGLKLPATIFWNFPTIATLAAELADRMGVSLDADPFREGAPPCEPSANAGSDGASPSPQQGRDSHRSQHHIGPDDGEPPFGDIWLADELRELLEELERLPCDQAQRLLTGEVSAGENR